jgi:hypothetical protein
MRSPHQNTVYTSPACYRCCTPYWSLSFLFDYPENLVRNTEHKAPQQQQLCLLQPISRTINLYNRKVWILYGISFFLFWGFKISGKFTRASEIWIFNHYIAFAERSTKNIIMDFQPHHTTEITPEPHVPVPPPPSRRYRNTAWHRHKSYQKTNDLTVTLELILHICTWLFWYPWIMFI